MLLMEDSIMNDTKPFVPTPGDGWIPGCFHDNRNKFPAEQLFPYQGKYVAWSLDGTQIIGSAETDEALVEQMTKKGYGTAFYVVSWIDDADSFGSF